MEHLDTEIIWANNQKKLSEIGIYLPDYRFEGLVFKLGEDGKVSEQVELEFENARQIYLAMEKLVGPLPALREIKNPDAPSLWIKIIFLIAALLAGELISRADTLLEYFGVLAAMSFVVGGGLTIFGMVNSKFREKRIQRKRDRKARQLLDQLKQFPKGQEPPKYSLFLRPFYLEGQLYSLTPSPPKYTLIFPKPWTTFHRRIETLISMASYTFGEFVALGTGGQSSAGAGKIESDEEWQADIILLSQKAMVIALIPSIRPGTLWEIEMLKNNGFLHKTVFFMPPYALVKSTLSTDSDLLPEPSDLKGRLSEGSLPILVHFSSNNEPDQKTAPRLEKLAKDYEGRITVEIVDVNSAPDVAKTYGIYETPKLLMFYEGKAVRQLVGLQASHVVAKMIDEVLQTLPEELPEIQVKPPRKPAWVSNAPPTWGAASGTGIFLGLVYAFANAKIETTSLKILVTLVAIHFTIISRKNKFTRGQLLFVILLMLFVGSNWTQKFQDFLK